MSDDYNTFTKSFTLDGETYTLHGRVSKGIPVDDLTFAPNIGLYLRLGSGSDGFMELTLPKNIIESVTAVSISMEDTSNSVDFDVVSNNQTHTLIAVRLPQGADSIDIKGVYVVPEFPSQYLPAIFVAVWIVFTIFQRRRVIHF